MPSSRYHIKVRGESGKDYSLAGDCWHSLDQAAELIGDLWGFKPEYIKTEWLAKIEPGKTMVLALGEIAITPMKLVIRRSDAKGS